jgi:recombination protein RecR
MQEYAASIKKLIEEFEKLPGVGKRTAERFTFHILNSGRDSALELAEAIKDVKTRITHCPVCFNLTDTSPCKICSSGGRDRSIICVVEQPVDVVSIEKIHRFHGLYHVLMGALSPLKGIAPGDINIAGLLERVEKGGVEEVIIATDSDDEGETTAQYLLKKLKPAGVKITRIATGIPVGATLDLLDERTLSRAIEGRTEQD